MRYINVAAYDLRTGNLFMTKKALKQACSEDPVVVAFYPTSQLDKPFHMVQASELPEFWSMSVVGPDPYDNRKWYAQVTRTSAGVVRVS